MGGPAYWAVRGPWSLTMSGASKCRCASVVIRTTEAGDLSRIFMTPQHHRKGEGAMWDVREEPRKDALTGPRRRAWVAFAARTTSATNGEWRSLQERD
jgi:hypothetical protein